MRFTAVRQSLPPPDDDESSENLESLAELRARLDISIENLSQTIRQTEQLLLELVVSRVNGNEPQRRQ